MGNQGSCTSYATSGRGIKVVGDDGRVEEYKRPIGAGELMVDNPGHFVCDSSSLHVGNRLPGLAADEELEQHRCYFLLPMDMLYSVLTEEEMEVLSGRALAGVRRGAMSSKKNARRLRRRSESRVQEKPVKSGVEGEEMVWWEVSSWRTALDTIEEDDD